MSLLSYQNVASLDWKDYGVDAIICTVTKHKNLTNGAIILMRNGAKYTAVAQLIHMCEYRMDYTGRQIAD